MDIKKIRDYQKETLPIYTAVVIDPISRFIVKYILKYNFRFKPYIYTYFGLLLSLISAYFFLNSYFLIGAIFFQISITFDCIDGYVARIQNTGSIFGIFSDGFVDFLRVFINLYALNISFGENNDLINLFTIYLLYIAFENTLNISLKDCTNYFKNKGIKKNFLDKKIILIKEKLRIKKIRFIWFYYHERYFLIFFLGPITGYLDLMFYFSILISLIFLILKILLDISMIKQD